MNYTFETEAAKTYWCQIRTKCQQIGKALESSPTKEVSLAEMRQLRQPCIFAQEATHKSLWDFLRSQHAEERIKLEDEPVRGVKITSLWLWAYFGYRLLGEESKIIPSYLRDRPFTPQEQLEFYQRLSAFFLYLLEEIKQEQQAPFKNVSHIEFIRSLVFLISEYSHLDIGIPRTFDLEKYLKEALSSDALLYSMTEPYRDHIFHVIDVCLLGFFLLNCKFGGETSLLSLISEGSSPNSVFQAVYRKLCKIVSKSVHERFLHKNRDTAVLQNWFLASLFHDIGYGMEIYNKVKDQLGFLEAPNIDRAKEGINNCIGEALLRFCREANNVLETDQVTSRKVKEELDHGIVSYLHVKELLESVPGGDTIVQEFKPGLQAIVRHNLTEEPIVFDQEPLSFLLILCDELQEWGRARVDSAELREAIMSKIIFSDPSILKKNKLLEYLFVNVELEKGEAIILEHSLDFCLFYRDGTEEHFEPLFIWLSKSYNLQRTQIDREQIEITIAMRHPICKDLGRFESPDLCEMSILRNFMRDRRKWRLLEDWIDGKNVLVHELKDCVENIVLQLNEFAAVELLHEHPKGIFEELFKWREDYIKGKRRRI